MISQQVVHDAKIFPYDWRYSVTDIVNQPITFSDGNSYSSLIPAIRALAATSDTGKVTIVAHSNGGLVTKALTPKLGTDAPKLIDQIIFVAVPEAGTPKAIGAILHGFDQGLPINELQFSITDSEARTLARNMPSAYNLLPSTPYFTYVDDPVIKFSTTTSSTPEFIAWVNKYGAIIHSSAGLQQFMTDTTRTSLPVSNALNQPIKANVGLYTKAVTLHTTEDVWKPPTGVQLTEIAGWGVDTLRTIEYSQDANGKLIYSPRTVMDGDGTVVVPSALWTATSTKAAKYWVDLGQYNIDHKISEPFGRKHVDILEVPDLRTFIQNILVRTITFPQYIWPYTPPNSIATDKRLHFILHSPLSLSLSDGKGNHTGVKDGTTEIEQNIPNSYYTTFGEVQYLSVPADTDLKLLMKGYKKGTFTLEVEEVQGDTVISNSKFSGIPSNEKTIATMDIPKGKVGDGNSELVVDMDGNGKRKMSVKMRKNEMVGMDENSKKMFAQDVKKAKEQEEKEENIPVN